MFVRKSEVIMLTFANGSFLWIQQRLGVFISLFLFCTSPWPQEFANSSVEKTKGTNFFNKNSGPFFVRFLNETL